jgi:hypothetical protein
MPTGMGRENIILHIARREGVGYKNIGSSLKYFYVDSVISKTIFRRTPNVEVYMPLKEGCYW